MKDSQNGSGLGEESPTPDHAGRVSGHDRSLTAPLVVFEAATVAAFSGRAGGVSTGPFSAANVSTRVGDDIVAVHTNRSRLMAGLALNGVPVVTARQRHTATVRVIGADDVPSGRGQLRDLDVVADGMVTRHAGVALMVGVADCVPVILCDSVHAVVGVLHVGWRGLMAGIIAEGVEQLRRAGGRGTSTAAALGPSIGPCCYPVSPHLRQVVAGRYASAAALSRVGEPALDLRTAVAEALRHAGVDEITSRGGCTYDEADRFFSARRDGRTGCQAAVVALRRE